MRHPQQSSLGGKIPSTIEPPSPRPPKRKIQKKKKKSLNQHEGPNELARTIRSDKGRANA
jgi:hypothetical protein